MERNAQRSPGCRHALEDLSGRERPHAGKASTSTAVARAAAESPAKAGQACDPSCAEGETLWSIAQAYQTTIDALRSGNRFLFSRSLQAGDILTIVQPPTSSQPTLHSLLAVAGFPP